MGKLKIKDGNNWIALPESGVGVPSGGTAGQVLVKSNSTDYATEWDDIVGVPAGGTAGQILTKTSATDYAAAWESFPWIIDTVTLDNQTATKSETTTFSVNVEKVGYTPIGVVGFNLTNSTNNGARVSYVFVNSVMLTSATTVRVATRNTNSSHAYIKIELSVLYQKN